ncbi:MAG: tRNA (N6-threonylcarbamoyladenosine(37)-N6)-methyltransferase TrmO [Candidatus Omnitrophota bacterium]|nr:MAG: tRNA (N6-threonylcarbamoyladenosine(37)-N6)-methyltransferase TrmO [Candidatus Omnitrophota bacterium]
MASSILFQPIGLIHTPFAEPIGMPIQPSGAVGVKGTVEVFETYEKGLKDLDGFSHIILLYHFHCYHEYSLEVKPYLDNTSHGLFATRAPKRPNPIGLSIVQLDLVEGNILHISNVDVVDGTPLLDIKPYVPDFDYWENARCGWLEKKSKNVTSQKSDLRL